MEPVTARTAGAHLPIEPAPHVLNDLQHVMMIAPVDAEKDEAQYVAENTRGSEDEARIKIRFHAVPLVPAP